MINISSIANDVANAFALLAGGMAAAAVIGSVRAHFVHKARLEAQTREVAKLVEMVTKQTIKTLDQVPNVVIMPGTGSIEVVTSGIDSPNVKVSIERSKTAQKELRIANG
jgi:hypothetical protein